jgi:hypothetical protein
MRLMVRHDIREDVIVVRFEREVDMAIAGKLNSPSEGWAWRPL